MEFNVRESDDLPSQRQAALDLHHEESPVDLSEAELSTVAGAGVRWS